MSLRIVALMACLVVQSAPAAARPPSHEITSPDGRLTLAFSLTGGGEPAYRLSFAGRTVVRESRLGLELKNAGPLTSGFVVDRVDTAERDETWRPVLGETRTIRNRYREMAVHLTQRADVTRSIVVRFRLFDDGLGFRYELPEQKELTSVILSGERTEINLAGDHTAFWIPGDYDTNEYAYTTSRLSRIDATAATNAPEISTRVPIGPTAVQTPLMLKTDDGLYVNVHEAGLAAYPAMHLVVDPETFSLMSHLTPDAVGNRAYLQTPARTPWRTVVVSDRAERILASKLILNLNDPSAIADTSWIRPQKYVGVWWEMHVGRSSWSYSDAGNVRLGATDFRALEPNGRHGATTANVRRYVDFAAAHGFDGVLVEGWNVGWEDWFGRWKEEVFDFVTPYPDFDVAGLTAYARSKGVKLIMHHETSSSATNYERRLGEAFRFMKRYGYDTVKTGYVGRIIPRGEYHDGQWMVEHYVRVVQRAAAERIMVNSHESARPTGLHRTWPNWIAAEAARGNEFNAWSRGNPPEHETILPFTRLMGGPMDYTPGIFRIKMDAYAPGKREQVHTTLAKQLALYVTMYSPLQMAADLPENYLRHRDAFRFIEEVAADWDDTWVLAAEPGDYVTIARKAKGRDAWFVGAITDEQSRAAEVALSFLPRGRRYVATIYEDAPDAHWESKPTAYRIREQQVTSETTLTLALAPGGGAAVSIRPAR